MHMNANVGVQDAVHDLSVAAHDVMALCTHTCVSCFLTTLLLQERTKAAMEKLEREMEQRAAHDKFMFNQVCVARALLWLSRHVHAVMTCLHAAKVANVTMHNATAVVFTSC